MQRSLIGNLTLTKLSHFIREYTDSKGNKQKCLVLPIDMNHFQLTEDNVVRMPVRVIVRDEADQYKQHGFVAQNVDSSTYKAATSEQQEQFKKLPILGGIRDFADSNNDASGKIEDVMTAIKSDPGDDLPF